MKCPHCNEPMELKETYQRAGAVIGGSIGGVGGAIAGLRTRSRFGGLAGAIVGAITGFVAGGTLGYKAGKLVDENYVAKYYCPNCKKTFSM